MRVRTIRFTLLFFISSASLSFFLPQNNNNNISLKLRFEFLLKRCFDWEEERIEREREMREERMKERKTQTQKILVQWMMNYDWRVLWILQSKRDADGEREELMQMERKWWGWREENGICLDGKKGVRKGKKMYKWMRWMGIGNDTRNQTLMSTSLILWYFFSLPPFWYIDHELDFKNKPFYLFRSYYVDEWVFKNLHFLTGQQTKIEEGEKEKTEKESNTIKHMILWLVHWGKQLNHSDPILVFQVILDGHESFPILSSFQVSVQSFLPSLPTSSSSLILVPEKREKWERKKIEEKGKNRGRKIDKIGHGYK